MRATSAVTEPVSISDIGLQFKWQRSLLLCARLTELSSTEDFIGVGDCLIQLSTRELFTPRGRQRLQEKPFTLLLIFIEYGERLVTRDILYERLWSGVAVAYQYGLDTVVKKLRQALGESRSTAKYIETLPRNGYRLLVPVHRNPSQIVTMQRALGAGNYPYRSSAPDAENAAEIDPILQSGYEHLARDYSGAIGMGLGLARQALDLAPDSGRSLSLLALAGLMSGMSGSTRPAMAWSSAKSAALRAVRAQPADSLPFCILCCARGLFEYDLAGAVRDWEHFIGEASSGWHSHFLRAHLFLGLGKPSQAYRVVASGRELYPNIQRLESLALLCARFARSTGQWHADLPSRPGSDLSGPEYNFQYGQLLLSVNALSEAIACLRRASEAMEENSGAEAMRGIALLRAGQTQQAQEIDHILDAVAERQRTDAYHRSILKEALGMRDAALGLLAVARDERSHWFALALSDPNLDPLRADARFVRLTRSLII
ncbi:MAG: winged helix-turn-helix domain-containing protein [Acidobacteriota bacterium]|nr:winged helix-turn-helix domain-containing protein [Acidobacteriota bacterium]